MNSPVEEFYIGKNKVAVSLGNGRIEVARHYVGDRGPDGAWRVTISMEDAAQAGRLLIVLSYGLFSEYDSNNRKGFAQRLNGALECFSREELMEICHVSSSTLSRWTSGKSVPATFARGVLVKRIESCLILRLGLNVPSPDP